MVTVCFTLVVTNTACQHGSKHPLNLLPVHVYFVVLSLFNQTLIYHNCYMLCGHLPLFTSLSPLVMYSIPSAVEGTEHSDSTSTLDYYNEEIARLKKVQ